MKKKIVVLGAGQVGRTIAIDLCRDYEVTSADNNEQNLQLLKAAYPVNTLAADLSNPLEITKAIAPADLVIGAVPGFMGFDMVRTVLSAGKKHRRHFFFQRRHFSPRCAGQRKKSNGCDGLRGSAGYG
jgi:saccharopine dehydrogenase-like NADP-dependent oxidoreductase